MYSTLKNLDYLCVDSWVRKDSIIWWTNECEPKARRENMIHVLCTFSQVYMVAMIHMWSHHSREQSGITKIKYHVIKIKWVASYGHDKYREK